MDDARREHVADQRVNQGEKQQLAGTFRTKIGFHPKFIPGELLHTCHQIAMAAGIYNAGSGGGLLDEAVILLVEDRQDDISIIAKAFAKAPLNNPVRVVPDGEKAIQYLKGESDYADRHKYPLPQLILLDLKLPKVDGFEFLKWLRARPEFGHVIVIVLTVSRHPEDVNRAYDLGANSFMVKPDDFQNITEMVKLLRDYWLLANKAPGHVRPLT